MRKRRGKRVSVKGDINITPLIDILLVLLVIFMTITPMTPRGFRTNVPQPPPPDTKLREPEDKTIVISLDKNGVLRVNQKEVELGALPGELLNIFKTRNDKTAFVQADNELLFDQVAHLIDAVKSGGVDRIGLMTEQITPKL